MPQMENTLLKTVIVFEGEEQYGNENDVVTGEDRKSFEEFGVTIIGFTDVQRSGLKLLKKRLKQRTGSAPASTRTTPAVSVATRHSPVGSTRSTPAASVTNRAGSAPASTRTTPAVSVAARPSAGQSHQQTRRHSTETPGGDNMNVNMNDQHVCVDENAPSVFGGNGNGSLGFVSAARIPQLMRSPSMSSRGHRSQHRTSTSGDQGFQFRSSRSQNGSTNASRSQRRDSDSKTSQTTAHKSRRGQPLSVSDMLVAGALVGVEPAPNDLAYVGFLAWTF
jgi:hypothetical protein